eukprot:6179225-Pleurochrysis_carterae.AAC.1
MAKGTQTCGRSSRVCQIGLELRAHATGSLILGAAGGYSNYVAISNTAIHIKCGGVSRSAHMAGSPPQTRER